MTKATGRKEWASAVKLGVFLGHVMKFNPVFLLALIMKLDHEKPAKSIEKIGRYPGPPRRVDIPVTFS